MKASLVKIMQRLEKIDPITGFPECMILGSSDVCAQSEHLARYLFARNYAKGFILDIAASSCYGSSILAGDGSNYVVSADLNRSSLQYGKIVFNKKNMDAICCDARYLPFRNSSFDAIISIETLEHVKNQPLFLESIRNIVKPSGSILLSTPNKNVTSPILSTPINPYHYKEYELSEITSVLKNSGIEVIAVFFQTRISIINFLARVINIFLASLLMKQRISLLPLRSLSKVFYFQSNKPFDPDPSMYPVSEYSRILDTFTNFQLIIIARKSKNG